MPLGIRFVWIAVGKTIAILPSPLDAISPAAHREMAHRISEEGGLVISEYYNGPRSRHEAINRYVERRSVASIVRQGCSTHRKL